MLRNAVLSERLSFYLLCYIFQNYRSILAQNSESSGLNVKARGWLKSSLVCFQTIIDFGSIIILSASGMNETFFFSIKFTYQFQKDLLDFSNVERTDFFVERTNYFMERSDYWLERSNLERCQRSDHGTKWPVTVMPLADYPWTN